MATHGNEDTLIGSPPQSKNPDYAYSNKKRSQHERNEMVGPTGKRTCLTDSPYHWLSLFLDDMDILSGSPEVIEGTDGPVVGRVEDHEVTKGGVEWGSTEAMNTYIVAEVNTHVVHSLFEEESIPVVVELAVVHWIHATLGSVDLFKDCLSVEISGLEELDLFGVPDWGVWLNS